MPSETLSVPARLSLSWIAVMLNMAFADILGFMHPGALAQISSGVVDGIEITPGFLLIASVFVEIPILMILLSRTLGPKWNRIANLVAASITTLFVIGGGSTTPTYLFFASVEVMLMIYIAAVAFRWTIPSSSSSGPSIAESLETV